jgi:hypothetical protein
VQAFHQAIVDNARLSLKPKPGCHRFDVCRDPGDPTLFFLYELYDDEAAFQAHLAVAALPADGRRHGGLGRSQVGTASAAGHGAGLREGVDAAALYEVITHSAGNSWMFENRMAHVLAADYTPLSAVDIFVKDLGLVLDTARASKFPLPLASTAHQMFMQASTAGLRQGGRQRGDQDLPRHRRCRRSHES